jgi:hypothetical protein
MERGAHWQCRLWWPKHLSRVRPAASMALVGWVSFSDSCSVDLVIAAACLMPTSQSLQVSSLLLTMLIMRGQGRPIFLVFFGNNLCGL